jgi:hypothetical protein
LLLAAAAIFAQGVAAAESPSQPPSPPPSPSPHIVGPPSPSSASPVVAQVIKAWTTMKSTLYSHKYSQRDAKTGRFENGLGPACRPSLITSVNIARATRAFDDGWASAHRLAVRVLLKQGLARSAGPKP